MACSTQSMTAGGAGAARNITRTVALKAAAAGTSGEKPPCDGVGARSAVHAAVMLDDTICLVDYESDTLPDKPAPKKRQKTEAEVSVKQDSTLHTCAATITPQEIRAFKNKLVKSFIHTHVLGGVPLTTWHDCTNFQIRQNVSQLVHNVNAFWCKANIVHLSGSHNA